ncbi:XRE family transcriptional regulator [Leucobacter muris]|uniref:XRE family transcriptional regulator n=1 Tax=Leucobacter muris TaxID=1935379 RepID=A0ABX5QEU1_9MICO|nr:helix-turn-helix transcriptional regulator [Leucobacter muris]QAB17518.1 XRE family transcriptional regulator [Leucobacter muris]
MSKKKSSRVDNDKRVETARQVKTLRVEMGMTQQELADAAGVTRQSVSNLELGVTTPQRGTVEKIFAVLGINPTRLGLSDETMMWIGMLGGILDALPEDRRARAGKAAVDAATAELVDMAKSGEGVAARFAATGPDADERSPRGDLIVGRFRQNADPGEEAPAEDAENEWSTADDAPEFDPMKMAAKRGRRKADDLPHAE